MINGMTNGMINGDITDGRHDIHSIQMSTLPHDILLFRTVQLPILGCLYGPWV